jgi:hypothetical protein
MFWAMNYNYNFWSREVREVEN